VSAPRDWRPGDERPLYVIRFLSGGRLDDRNYAFLSVFLANFRLPSDPSPGWPRLTETTVSDIEGRLTPQRHTRAELYPLLGVVMEGRGWSTAYVSPRHHRDLLAEPKRRSVRRSCDS
jgi:hypothetical protein